VAICEKYVYIIRVNGSETVFLPAIQPVILVLRISTTPLLMIKNKPNQNVDEFTAGYKFIIIYIYI